MTALRRRVLFALAPLAIAAASVGCAKSTSAAGVAGGKVNIPASQFKNHTGHATVSVEAVDNDFEDSFITVSTGTKVTWTNDGRNDHSVTPVHSGSFVGASTKQFTPGQSHSAVFTNPGDYPYYCTIHGTANLTGQSGVVRVVAHS